MKHEQLKTLKKRSVSGVFITAIVQGASLAGGFFLSIMVSPQLFGIFTLVVATAAFLSYFSDIGLAAALIQKKTNVTREDLITTFTIQQTLVAIIAVTAFAFSSAIGDARGFSAENLWLFRALIAAFILSSFKTIPSVILERELEFGKLAVPQILEIITFNIIIVSLAFSGWGIAMFSVAVLARGIIGLVSMYVVKPWVPGLWIYRQSAKKLVTFGIPFQANSLLALVKDQLFVMFLPLIMPITAVGYVGWAKKWAEIPLRLFMDNVVRVTFPTYSRLQAHPKKLTKGVNKTLFALMLLVLPMSVGMIFLIKPLVYIIPKYVKWEPALFSFYLFVVASAVAAISTPLINALNAIGKIKISLYFMTFWTVFMWVAAPILVSIVGFDGVALSAAVMSLTALLVVLVAKKYIAFNAVREVVPAVAASLFMGVVLYVSRGFIGESLFSLLLYALFGAGVYFITLFILFREKTLSEIRYIIAIIRS